ncbi:MAG: DNA polymerase/3'-5' exonuclease PolX [Gammaproteobacteria bacterium]|nr:DNA polymerase/3'-5' exonuclease PolX [Gammaproteobacteria bacterium]
MSIHNSEIADTFEKLADLLEIENANPFRVRAYRNAALTVRGHARSMAELVAEGEDLSKLPAVGRDLAAKIRTLVKTGELPALKQAEARTPGALRVMLKIDGLGPKRVRVLHQVLKIRSLRDLERAALNGRVRSVPGFGAKTEARIIEQIGQLSEVETRSGRLVAEEIAKPLVAYLQTIRGVRQVTLAGSFRRRRESVGDLDILVTATRNSAVMQRFVTYDEVVDVIAQGQTRATVRLHSGMQVDLRMVPQVSYGAALHYFTGSKAHNIAVRRLAMDHGLKLNEYGVFRDEKRIAGRTEQEVFAAVGLPYIEPELRENRGEIEAALQDRLPLLVSGKDIRGDLHCHTKASDGHASLEEMAGAARAKGYEYLAISDHSRRVTVAHGLDATRLAEQIDAIDRLNETLEGLVLLKACEVDILDNGKLDLPDSILARLDLTVCAVHYKFALSRRRQTERILRAMDNPNFNVLAHPTGRLINHRQPYEVDLERLMRAARENGCFMELNAHPDRLDLTDEACLMAREIGLKVAISTDAHSTSSLDFMRFGIDQARRGWLSVDDVINTRSLKALRRLLRR